MCVGEFIDVQHTNLHIKQKEYELYSRGAKTLVNSYPMWFGRGVEEGMSNISKRASGMFVSGGHY